MTDLAVARSFGRSAASYDANAQVQLAASKSLVAMVPDEIGAGIAVDVGAGTVPMARALQQRTPACRWLALDISSAMLAEARRRGRLEQGWSAVCADAEHLPLANNSVQLVYSCFALQWCQSPRVVMAEIERVLAPGGHAVMAVPVAGSLSEFQHSWQAADSATHFNRLPNHEEWSAASSDLILNYQQQLAMREHYADVRAIATMLKTTGADHVRRDCAPGLMTPTRYQKIINAYDQLREPQGLPLSWQVLFMSWQKPS